MCVFLFQFLTPPSSLLLFLLLSSILRRNTQNDTRAKKNKIFAFIFFILFRANTVEHLIWIFLLVCECVGIILFILFFYFFQFFPYSFSFAFRFFMFSFSNIIRRVWPTSQPFIFLLTIRVLAKPTHSYDVWSTTTTTTKGKPTNERSITDTQHYNLQLPSSFSPVQGIFFLAK